MLAPTWLQNTVLSQVFEPTSTLLGLHQSCSSVYADDQAASNLGVKSPTVTGLLHPQDPPDPCHHLMRRWVGWFVQVNEAWPGGIRCVVIRIRFNPASTGECLGYSTWHSLRYSSSEDCCHTGSECNALFECSIYENSAGGTSDVFIIFGIHILLNILFKNQLQLCQTIRSLQNSESAAFKLN